MNWQQGRNYRSALREGLAAASISPSASLYGQTSVEMMSRKNCLTASLTALVISLVSCGAWAADSPTDCDRLAGSPEDVLRVAEGVSLYGIDDVAAVPACERAVAAAPGNARLLYELGNAYEARALGDKRHDQAAKAFRAAAEMAYPAALVATAGFDWYEPNPEKAMADLDEAAQRMPVQAKRKRSNLLGDVALNPGAPEPLRRYVATAAEHGDADALYWLGVNANMGTEARAEAVRLWTQAAALGQAQAAVELARLYAEGRNGLAKNLEEARRLLKKAEASDDPQALISVAFFYRSGRYGLLEDAAAALKLLQKASEQGYAPAQEKLAENYERGEGDRASDPREAARLYKLAADNGDGDAALALARFMNDGLGGFVPDKAKAVAYLKRAARWSFQAKDALKAMGETP